MRRDVHGLIVSNHGGRNLDTAMPCRCWWTAASERGTDVLKALGLGASAVLVGRPVGAAGAAGAAHVPQLLRDELAVAMAQCGVMRPAAASRGLLAPESPRNPPVIANAIDSHLY